MVKTKHTPCRTNAKGNLPALAAPKRGPEWGTAAKTFVEKFKLPWHPIDVMHWITEVSRNCRIYIFLFTVQYSTLKSVC